MVGRKSPETMIATQMLSKIHKESQTHIKNHRTAEGYERGINEPQPDTGRSYPHLLTHAGTNAKSILFEEILNRLYHPFRWFPMTKSIRMVQI